MSWRPYAEGVLVFAAVVLLLNALFNVIAWPRFFRRMAADARAVDAKGARTAFYRAHSALLAVALILAAASTVAGIVLLITALA